MNQKIIEMVRRMPGIKTGQIADQLDVDFAEAQMMLAKLANEGRIKGQLSQLVGGGKVMAWELCGVAPIQASSAAAKPESMPVATDLETELSKIGRADNAGMKTPAEAAVAIAAKRPYSRKPAASPAATASSNVADMRICMWSDGVLEVQIGGRTAITFNRESQELLRNALGA